MVLAIAITMLAMPGMRRRGTVRSWYSSPETIDTAAVQHLLPSLNEKQTRHLYTTD